VYDSIRGTKDILPEESKKWEFLERTIREVARLYNVREIRIPTFERTELFYKSTGEDTDIVQKEMYTFTDKGGRSLTLKPEGTPGVVRAFLQYSLHKKRPFHKLFYIERMFRQERPQKGRYREFYQFGVEIIGSASPLVDVELISMVMNILERLGIKGTYVRVNSLGCDKCRADYRKALKEYLKGKLPLLCENCRRRYETNPLRILDCKVDAEKLTDAPRMIDFLCDECKEHHRIVIDTLKSLNIPFKEDSTLVRGLDYYTRTVFEFIHPSLGAQDSIGGGGRYDTLIKSMGGPDIPAAGFAMGMERMLLAMGDREIGEEKPVVFFVALGDDAKRCSFNLLEGMRKAGVKADMDYIGRSMKAQMREANRLGALFTYIIGEDEIKKGVGILKNMGTGEQMNVPMDVEEIKRRIS